MRLNPILEVSSWITVSPAILLALAHSNLGELGLGAFGPPAATILGRWLTIGGVLAGTSAVVGRNRRTLILSAASFASLGMVAWQHIGYSTRDVEYAGNGVYIAATIYSPKGSGPHPAMVLVHGSAPVKRGFYSVWAERLAQDGAVVIVPDKRGVGGTGGSFERNNNSSKANLDTLAGDVVATLDYATTLAEVDTAKLGLFGLSQAGWTAPMAAVRSARAKYLVMITSPTVSVHEEGVWSRLRGDDQRAALVSAAAADRIMDTVHVGGVDARTRLGALSIPGLWLFASGDNSIPTAKSTAVLDSLQRLGHRYEYVVYPESDHLLLTRAGRLIPRFAPASWDALRAYIKGR